MKCKCGFEGTQEEISVHRQSLKPFKLHDLLALKGKRYEAALKIYEKWEKDHFENK